MPQFSDLDCIKVSFALVTQHEKVILYESFCVLLSYIKKEGDIIGQNINYILYSLLKYILYSVFMSDLNIKDVICRKASFMAWIRLWNAVLTVCCAILSALGVSESDTAVRCVYGLNMKVPLKKLFII